MPLDVPSAMDAEIVMQVGLPKLRLPTSEKACPVILRSFAHLTTSHGFCGVSKPSVSWTVWLVEDCRECRFRNAGDEARGELEGDDKRARNRLSKGRNEGVGLWP